MRYEPGGPDSDVNTFIDPTPGRLIDPVYNGLAVEFTDCHVPRLRMVDTLHVTQDPANPNRVLPVLLVRPSGPERLRPDVEGRMGACLSFVIQDATLPAINPFHTVRLLIYPKDPRRLVPMWLSYPGTARVNCSCGLPWAFCHVVGPHHHTLRSRDFEEAFTSTGQSQEVNGHG